jgi:hypothetical protein
MFLRLATVTSVAVIASGATIASRSVVAQVAPPAVSPERLSDVPLANRDSAFFYNYSWRSFIALNWPAMVGPGGRPLAASRGLLLETQGDRAYG